MANKQTKRGTVHSAAAEGPDFAGATAGAVSPEMLQQFAAALKNPPAAAKEAAAEMTVEEAQAAMLKIRAMLPPNLRPVFAKVAYESGAVELSDIILHGAHERNLWNAARRIGGTSVNVNRFVIGTCAVIGLVALYNKVLAPYFDIPTVGELLGE